MGFAALTAAWNSTQQPPSGVTGTGLTSTMTTSQKLGFINGWTITGVVPASLFTTGAAIANCIVWSEFNALSSAAQTNLLLLCAIAGGNPLLAGGSTNAALLVDGMMLANFSSVSVTRANLTALAQAQQTPWWQVSTAQGGGGLNSPVSGSDLVAAGNLT